MTRQVNETHDASLRSWVESANDPESDFPIQNLPFGVFRRTVSGEAARGGIAIGDWILDIAACRRAGLLEGPAAEAAAACDQPTLSALMALGPAHWSVLRAAASRLLREGSDLASGDAASRGLVLPMSEATMSLPAAVGDYTDFYASVHHATNVGSMFRPDNPLLPNYKHVPIGYHGRASSVVASGTVVRRPHGQLKDPAADAPTFGPTRLLDYESEVGWFVGPGNELGSAISIEAAGDHIFGLCLVNDWSARDIQAWEYQPLGPFLSKSFATTISPWVVTLEALAPFRAPAFARPTGDPEPLPHLSDEGDQAAGGIDLALEVVLSSARMREDGTPPARLSRTSFANMYWTMAQMLTHHASNGCNLRPGDLLASGTVSGPEKSERGCMLELTWRGAEPIRLPNGEERKFLQDGDEVIMRGTCTRSGFRRIGFGECRGVVGPAA